MTRSNGAHTVPAAAERPDVSVVIPTYRGAAHIAGCLRSLARQILAPARFEVVVIQNGPPDSTAQVLDAVAAEHPELVVRRLRLSEAGAGRARNVGLAAARGRYVTFVDDDDEVSPEYLAALLACSGPTTVGLAHLADVADANGAPDFKAGATVYQLGRDEAVVPADQLPSALSYTVAKMVPIELARSVGFDPALRSGEDVVFWAQVFAESHFDLGLCPVEAHAVYYRAIRTNSVSRQVASYDFSVTQRLDVIERLERIARVTTEPGVLRVVTRMRLGQIEFTRRFLRTHPEAYSTVVTELRTRGLDDVVVASLKIGLARDLAILYVALPHADTSAFVAARRMRKAGVLRDVISSDMSSLRGIDTEAHRIWDDFVDRIEHVPTRPSTAWWPGIMAFCQAGFERIDAWEREKGPYRSVYSRAMWPASHVLAAWYKIRNPEVEWIAEFSDPLVHDIKGEVRDSSGKVDAEFLDLARGAMRVAGFEPPEGDNLYLWVERLAYALADTVLFTNEHQRTYMLDYCDDRALAARALERSEVEAHPTLPEAFYEAVTSDYVLEPGCTHIAYFGVFYATRGLTEVVDALRGLAPELRCRVRLHVFTSKPDELAEDARRAGLDDVIVANPYVGYLEFLNLTTRFDALLVNDARTVDSHEINPYMPSKWSDYAGSGTPIWGIVEPGSVLSSRPLDHCSNLGDVEAARAVLEQVIVTAGSELVAVS